MIDLRSFLAALLLALASLSQAADVAITGLPAAIAVTGSDIVPIVQGGTTKKATLSLLDGRINRQTFSNAAASVTAPNNVIEQTGTMSASRVLTLGAANAYKAGELVKIADVSGTVTSANTIVVTRAGSDTINGATTFTLGSAYSAVLLESDGSSKWTRLGGASDSPCLIGTPVAGSFDYYTGPGVTPCNYNKGLFTWGSALQLNQAGASPIDFAGSTITAGQFGQAVSAAGVLSGATLSAKNAQTSTYQVLAADFTGYKTITVSSGTFTITLVASGSQPANGTYVTVLNYGSGVVTIARSGQNINGGTTSLTIPAGSATAPSSARIMSDGTDYFAAMTAAPSGALGTPTAVVLTNGTGLPVSTGVSGLGTGVASALAVNVGSAGAFAPYAFTTGTSRTVSAMAEIVVCTSTCTITVPASATAGMQFCVQNDDGVSTVITLAAVSGVQFEVTARTSYKSANTALVSAGAIGNQICMVAVSATKWNVFGFLGTWS